MSTETAGIDDAALGSSFDDFLLEEGMHDEVNAGAEKAVIVLELEAAMRAEKVSKAELARRMGTSPSAVTRLLDPKETAVTLKTLQKAATALRRVVHLRLSEPAEARQQPATDTPQRTKAPKSAKTSTRAETARHKEYA